jgi:hypothetical protein
MSIEKSNLCLNMPTSLRIMNFTANLLNKVGLATFHGLSAEKLLESAQKKTKLSNFGNEHFLEHLRFIVKYFDDNHLSYMGKTMLLNIIQSALNRRLHLEREFQKHPEILQIPIEKPVIVTGFPRSGTTLLQTVLLHHSGCRWLREWELEEPFPTTPGIWGSSKDSRKLRSEAILKKKLKNKFLQDLSNINPLGSPLECWMLWTPTMVFRELFLLVGTDRYKEWCNSISQETFQKVYDYYQCHLQYLSWCQPGCHWVLKSPVHMIHLETILARFPDAKVIQLHRDPKEFIPSFCSLMMHYQCLTHKREKIDPEKIGRDGLYVLSEWCQQNITLRKKIVTDQIYDVSYQALVENPITTVRNIYNYFAMELPVDMEMLLNQWLQNRHGKNRPHHKYSLDQFGLKPEEINGEFQEYYKHF